MLKMKLLSIKIENFMAYGSETFEFGRRTTIYGKNAAGKSSIATAYSWLLYNTDMDGNDNPDIRREVGGVPVDGADVSVTGTLDMDGRVVTLQKIQRRKYNKDDRTKYADSNSYLINDVPKTLKEYNEFLGGNVDTLKICGSVNAFLDKKDKDIREFLFKNVEELSDAQIAESNGMNRLANMLREYTREEIEAMNKKIKRDVDSELPVIRGQIAEKERDISIKSAVDVAEYELAKKDFEKRLEENTKKREELSAKRKKHMASMDKVMELKFKLSGIESEESKELEKRKRAVRFKLIKTKEDAYEIEQTLVSIKNKINNKENIIKNIECEIESIQRVKEKTEYETCGSLDFCSMCGQKLPEERIESIKVDVENKKRKKLERINGRINELCEELENAKKSLISPCIEKANLEKKLYEKNQRISEAEETFNALPDIADVTANEEYMAVKEELQKAVDSASENDTSAFQYDRLVNEEKDIRSKLSEIKDKLSFADTNKDEERLEELIELIRTKEQVKTTAEGVLDELNELDKAKNEMLNKAINSKFGIVEWKLWELNKSGTYKSVCIPMVDGKSILTIKSNKGNRFLGKLDICKSLQKISGIECPVWVDDCESMDKLSRERATELVDSQLIMLVVSDEKFRIEKE